MDDMEETIEVELPPEKEVLPNGKHMMLEETLKHRGKWRLHANDPDDIFPSDLHAHNMDGNGERLDLYTGRIYDREGRSVIGSMKEKDMLYFVRWLRKNKNPSIQTKLGDPRLAAWMERTRN